MNRRNQAKKISLLLAAALVFSGCGAETDSGSETASSAIAVKAVEAELGTLTVSNQFIGTVSPQQQVSIVPLVSGEVDAVYAEVGDEVKAGDVLFHIKDDAARLQMENAELSKQGAELSAQMQLGSAQVMNNISMQSNIRSLEYQLEMAKDQYNSAVDGIADAEDAKEEMNSAIDEINHSVKELQGSQSRMEEVVSEAGKYIDPASYVTGNYAYKSVYEHAKDPSHYRWKDTKMPESDPDSKPTEPEKTDEASGDNDQAAERGTEVTDSTEGAGNETGDSGQTGAETDGGNAVGTNAADDVTDVPEVKTEAPDSEETENAETESVTSASAEGGENGAGKTQNEDKEDTSPDASENGKAPASYAGFSSFERGDTYFSVEVIREAPLYLAEQDGYEEDDGKKPYLSETTEKEAWDRYNEQQKINAAARAAKEMGYSAEDIGSGKAQAELLENSAQIVMLQYQASQLESNQSTVDSSIKSAESARDTTEKTIDFYEDNLENAQITYGISNGQAYQDTAGALATQIQAADVGVRSAQLQLEYYSPTTPISGTVVSKTVEQYGLVQPGYAAYVISNQDAMDVTFAVSGQVRETLQVGMPVTLEKSGITYTGTITEIGETVDQQSGGLFLVKAITEADGEKLASGTAVKLTVDTYRAENAVLIPYDAVHFESEQAYVFVIVDYKAVRTPVTIGLISEDTVEITEGLAAGSQVVATWSSQLEDGADLRIIGESQNTTGSGAQGASETQGATEVQGAMEAQSASETQSTAETQDAAEMQNTIETQGAAEPSGSETGEAEE